MKKLLTLAVAASALAIGAPAAAQNWNQGYANANAGGTVGIGNRIAQLQTRLQAGVQAGTISRAEAQSIRPQLRQLRDLERQYSVNGLSQQERMDLQQRIRSVRQQLRTADNNSYDRYERSAEWNGYDTGYGQYGQYNQGYGQGQYNQGYGQGQYNQGYNQGYGQGGYYGQGGPYEEVGQTCASRGVLGSILSGVFGSDNCLRVGERVSGNNLSALPYQYSGQFRDGGNYVHRYVNGNVVQIDARTGVVTRIWDVR